MARRTENLAPDVFAVSPIKAQLILDIGHTQLYGLLGRDELESFWIGRSRKITVRSIYAYIDRRLAEARETKPRPRRRHDRVGTTWREGERDEPQ